MEYYLIGWIASYLYTELAIFSKIRIQTEDIYTFMDIILGGIAGLVLLFFTWVLVIPVFIIKPEFIVDKVVKTQKK